MTHGKTKPHENKLQEKRSSDNRESKEHIYFLFQCLKYYYVFFKSQILKLKFKLNYNSHQFSLSVGNCENVMKIFLHLVSHWIEWLLVCEGRCVCVYVLCVFDCVHVCVHLLQPHVFIGLLCMYVCVCVYVHVLQAQPFLTFIPWWMFAPLPHFSLRFTRGSLSRWKTAATSHKSHWNWISYIDKNKIE